MIDGELLTARGPLEVTLGSSVIVVV